MLTAGKDLIKACRDGSKDANKNRKWEVQRYYKLAIMECEI